MHPPFPVAAAVCGGPAEYAWLVFGRRTQTPASTPEPEAAVAAPKPGGKGRPTPKRSEAEQSRRERARPPQSRKEAYRRARELSRAERAKTRQALITGDERNLPARDRGPVRGYVRDVVDSRRSIGQYYLPVALVVLLASFFPVPTIVLGSVYALMFMMIAVIIDSLLLSRRLRRELRERFPDDDTRGAVLYGVMRSLQMRRLRLPPPRVEPGKAL